MADNMQNLNIKDFTTVSGVNDGDYVLLTRGGTTHGKIAISLLKTAVGAAISPEIGTDGNWYIGGINTNTQAEGRTPQLSLYERGICVRYSDDEDWALLVPLSELSIDFDTLTDEQIAQLKMTIEDLSPEDIALLQQPARDMIDELEQTNTDVARAEQVRVQAEQDRVSAETQRASAENTRQLNETTRQGKEAERQTAEASRQSAETSRINAEDGRSDAEAVRVGNESTRQANESTRQSSETARTTAESQRIAAETARQEAEEARAQAETTRQSQETTRQSNEQSRNTQFSTLKQQSETATANTNAAIQEAHDISDELRTHPTKVGEAGTWEVWNATTKQYDNTNVDAQSGYELTKAAVLAVFPELANAVTNWGDYLTADAPHPKNALAKMGGTRFISLEQTEEAPMGVWTDAEGNRLTYADGGYALTGEVSTKWEKLCLNE